MVPVVVVEVTAQIVTRVGSQIVTSIDEKLGVCDAMVLGETMQERRPQKSEISDVLHENAVLVNVGGSLCVSASVSFQNQIA